MKLSFERLFLTLLILVTTIFSYACSAQGDSQPIPTKSENVGTETPVKVTAFAPTELPLPKPPTPTLRSVSTPTRLPLLRPENARSVMIDFLETNGGCKFPCLLGLTPGVSDQASIDAWVNYFQDKPIDNEDIYVGGFATIVFYNKQTTLRVSFHSAYLLLPPGSGLKYVSLSTGPYNLQRTEIIYDNPVDTNILVYYSLANILQTYGAPSEIWVLPFPTDPLRPDETYQFSVLLFYPQNHFIVEYDSARREDRDDYFGCQPTSYIHLATWVPNQQKNLIEAVEILGGEANSLNIELFKSLQDATGLTIEGFYNTFRESQEPACLRTPKSIWPFSETTIIP